MNIDGLHTLTTVTCQGADHRIGVRTDGSLVIFDHDSSLPLVDQLAVKATLPPTCECARIYRQWSRAERRYEVPVVLQHAYTKIVETKQRVRRQQHCYEHSTLMQHCHACTLDPLTLTLRTRLAERVVPIADACLRRSSYRTGTQREGKHAWELCVVHRGEPPTVRGALEREWDKSAGEKGLSVPITRISAYVRLSWLTRVHARGLALVAGGLFVLDVLETRPRDRYVVLAIKQSRGYDVVPHAAIYDARKDVIRWY